MKYFCVNCGREVKDPDELVDGYCIDCFVKKRGVLKSRPVAKFRVCRGCGSVFYRGTWHEGRADLLKEILKNSISKYLVDGAEVIDLDDLGIPPEHLSTGEMKIGAKVLFRGRHVLSLELPILLTVEQTLCPRCRARIFKTYASLVQIRGEKNLDAETRRELVEFLDRLGINEHIVELSETREGVDVKLDDLGVARKVAMSVATAFGARVVSSFSPKRYDPSRGSWRGIVSFSVRLPSLRRGDLMFYKDRIYIVDDLHGPRIVLRELDNESVQVVDVKEYWRGILRKPKRLEVYEALVTGVDDAAIRVRVLRDGEIREVKRKSAHPTLKPGDKVRIIVINEKEYVVKEPAQEGG
ncbi:MAG: 60S ribosomal export protein NMD3 [Desulfurococcaceae archaeon]